MFCKVQQPTVKGDCYKVLIVENNDILSLLLVEVLTLRRCCCVLVAIILATGDAGELVSWRVHSERFGNLSGQKIATSFVSHVKKL